MEQCKSSSHFSAKNISTFDFLSTLNQFLVHFFRGRLAESVGHLTRKSAVLGLIPGRATYFRFSFAFSRRAVVSYCRNYVHEVLVNRLGGLSLPRKSVVRLTDCPDMTLDVYRGRKTTIQQQHFFRIQQESRTGAHIYPQPAPLHNKYYPNVLKYWDT